MHPNIHPRNPFIAVAMSLVLPGFGQLYNGEANKAIWLFIAFAGLSIPGLACVALYSGKSLMLPILVFSLMLTLAIWLYGMLDAGRMARLKQDYVKLSWQISGVYTLIFLACVIAQLFLLSFVREHQVQSFYIPSSSMEPGILQGDVLFADMRYNCPDFTCKGSIKRGDVAIFVYPNDRTKNYIKRIIGLPGDKIRINGHAIWVNEKPLTQAQQTQGNTVKVSEVFEENRWQVQWRKTDVVSQETSLTVLPGHAFVLGDNRDTSQDSRLFGTVPIADIVGRARQIWFSKQAQAGIRWDRLGRVVE